MSTRSKYRRRAQALVVAVQLNLDTQGLTYRKWGGEQRCESGDWIVDNRGEVYTVNRETFERTYRAERPGLYRKITPVWAELADHDGSIRTQEGLTRYRAGDYLVFNDEQGQDGYAVDAPAFEAMYEAAE
jgi:hypothetical protein